MFRKSLALVLVLTALSARASGPGAPLRVSHESPTEGRMLPLEEVSFAQLEEYGRRGIPLPERKNVLAAKQLTSFLEAMRRGFDEADGADAMNRWQTAADGFIEYLPRALGKPTYFSKYTEPLLTVRFTLEFAVEGDVVSNSASLTSYLDEERDCMRNIRRTPADKQRLLTFYDKVEGALLVQKESVDRVSAAGKEQGSLRAKLMEKQGAFTGSLLSWWRPIVACVAIATLVATGFLVRYLLNRPSRKCNPEVEYCK